MSVGASRQGCWTRTPGPYVNGSYDGFGVPSWGVWSVRFDPTADGGPLEMLAAEPTLASTCRVTAYPPRGCADTSARACYSTVYKSTRLCASRPAQFSVAMCSRRRSTISARTNALTRELASRPGSCHSSFGPVDSTQYRASFLGLGCMLASVYFAQGCLVLAGRFLEFNLRSLPS